MAAKKSANKKKTKGSDVSIVEELVTKLLALMGTSATPKVTEDKTNEALLIEIESENETGLLIGSRGDTLQAIQTIVGMMYKRQTGEWKRILVDVADWRRRQEEKLTQLAQSTAMRAKESGESLPLYNLSPAERRIVHMSLVDDDDVETESVGEGQDRHLVIHPKEEK